MNCNSSKCVESVTGIWVSLGLYYGPIFPLCVLEALSRLIRVIFHTQALGHATRQVIQATESMTKLNIFCYIMKNEKPQNYEMVYCAC